MGIREDHPECAERLEEELKQNEGKCFYDENKRKIVYYNDKDAFHAYNQMEKLEMEKHKLIESQKAGHDLGEAAADEWIRLYVPKFKSFWTRTHAFVPSKDIPYKGRAA